MQALKFHFLKKSGTCAIMANRYFHSSKTLLQSYHDEFHATDTGVYGGMPKEKFIEFVENITPFGKNILNVKVEKVKTGELIIKVPFQNHLVGNPAIPSLHGGVLAAAIDHTGGFCAWTVIEPTAKLATVDLRIDYLRPAPTEDLIYKAKVVEKTKNMIRVDVICFNSHHKKVAIGRGLFHIYYSSPKPQDIPTPKNN